jgi:hypothetical protein
MPSSTRHGCLAGLRLGRAQVIVLGTLLSVLAAPLAIARDKKPSASTGAAAGKSRAAKRPTLEEKSDPKGFTIKVHPHASEKRDEWSTVYSATLPDASVITVTVSVETLDELTPVTSLEKAVEAVLAARPRGMTATISEQKELPRGYLVIIGPEYGTYAVNVIRNGKEVQVKAHCSGPASRLEELKEICLSVKPTK